MHRNTLATPNPTTPNLEGQTLILGAVRKGNVVLRLFSYLDPKVVSHMKGKIKDAWLTSSNIRLSQGLCQAGITSKRFYPGKAES